jgi:hypothetical protein
VLLGASAARADPRTPAEARVALERQRSRYAQALDRASWRRDDPSVRAVADEVTAEALATLDDAPALDGEVRTLVREAAGAALGPWLRQRGVMGDTLLGAWLRGHDDPGLMATLGPRDPYARLALAQELVLDRPELVADFVGEGIRTPNPRMGDFCAVALALPDVRRRELATLVANTPRGELFADCLALISSHPPLRLALARRALAELERPPPAQPPGSPALFGSVFDDVAWPVAAAALVAGDVPEALTRRMLAAMTRRGGELSWTGALAMLSRVAPSLRPEHPRVAAVLAEIDRRTPGSIWRVMPIPDRARAAALAASPSITHDPSDDAVRDVALAAPRDPTRAVAALRSVAVSASNGDFNGRVTVRLLLAWIEALERAARCNDEVCLRALVRDASDETAARAASLLGPQALATMPEGDASALVRRLVMEVPVFEPLPSATHLVESSSLARVVYGSLRVCPVSLAGLGEIAPFGLATWDDAVAPWRRAFALRCRDARPPRAP